ncbi:MAG: helix-turn-helix domain-containing protein [Gemmatimonadaceae bacterium]
MTLFWRDPHPLLSAFVSTLWLADGYVPGSHRKERILPTANCNLIIDLGTSGHVRPRPPQRTALAVDRVGLSHRRFLDVFTAHVGVTPKVFCRIRRFQRVLQRVHEGGEVEWARVALSCDYYDQAHFIREFQAFSGVNPSTY